MSRKRLTINACAIAAILTLSYVLCRYIASRFAFAERLSRPVFITVALRNYHSITGHLPPSAEDRGHAGAPASWRVLILPQEGLNNVYTRYDFNQIWNSIQNKSLLSEIPENIYGCDQLGYKKGKTNYVAVIGPETVWAPAFTTGDVLRRNAYSGKCITTVWLIELAGSDIDWAEPRDLTVRDAIAYLQGSKSSPWGGPRQFMACVARESDWPFLPRHQPKY